MTIRVRANVVSVLVCAIVGALVLTACTPVEPVEQATGSADEILAAHDLAGLGVRDLIEQLEATPLAERPTDLIASVQPDALLLSVGDDRSASVPLPDDQFYLSVAPYADQTHECFFHSLTTCLGELRNEDAAVKVTTEDGTVLIDEVISTNDNGFLGLWLPRNIDATLTVQHDGRSASGPISTRGGDATCLTTLRLA